MYNSEKRVELLSLLDEFFSDHKMNDGNQFLYVSLMSRALNKEIDEEEIDFMIERIHEIKCQQVFKKIERTCE